MSRPLFDYTRPLSSVLAGAHERIRAAIHAEADSYLRDADAGKWAVHLAEKYAADIPVVLEDQIALHDLGEREVDATGMPGESFSSSEWGGPIIRTGREFQLVVPVEGGADLLRYGPSGGTPVVEHASVEGNMVFSRWQWPIVRGSEALDEEVKRVIDQVLAGAAKVAEEVAVHNRGLVAFATKTIAERRSELERHSDFVSGLTVPVQRREDAPATFFLPPIERRKRPGPLAPKPVPVSGPALGKFYEEILDVIRPRGRAMERTPGSFADRTEEQLRDDLLVSLNEMYRGQAGAESFNMSGKTDLLLRVQDHNAFIAECKWWSGPIDMSKALDQLYGYSTWRDSRLALIFFVGTKDPAAVVEKARAILAERAEFDGWAVAAHERELRCRVRWPEDPGRTATLTVLFFHLPRGQQIASAG